MRKPVQNPIRELLLWAIISNRVDKVDQICGSQRTKLQWYIFVAVICRRASPHCKVYNLNGLKMKFITTSKKYEQLACELMTNLSRENPDLAIILSRRTQPAFGYRSLIDAANFGDLLDFMGTSPVQEIISKMWFGGLEPEGRSGPFICALFFPPIAPVLLQATDDIHIDFDAPFCSTKTTITLEDSSKMQTETTDLTYFQKLYIFLTSPYTSWCYNVLAHIVFLVYFSYFIILKFCIVAGPHEAIIVIMLLSMVVEQFRKYAATRGSTRKNKLRGLFSSWFNILFFLSFTAMSFGALFRFSVRIVTYFKTVFLTCKNFNV